MTVSVSTRGHLFTHWPTTDALRVALAACALTVTSSVVHAQQLATAPGKGTTVRLMFPAASQSVDETGRQLALGLPLRPLRVLIIDDDPLIIGSLRETLRGDGHYVTAAEGAQAGIDSFEAARARGEPFELVITDLGMPYVDGRRVSATIKAASPNTPIVLLTGWGQRLTAENQVPPHVDRVLNKPPRLHELQAALAEPAHRA